MPRRTARLALLLTLLLAPTLVRADEPPALPTPKPDPVTTRCLLAAGSHDDLPYCFYRPSPTLELRPAYVGYVALGVMAARNTMDLISRWDDVDLAVVTPVLDAAVGSPTGRWGVSASLLVDVAPTPNIAAAPPDLVSSASSQPAREVRYAPALGGHVRFGDVDVDLHGAFSDKPDDVSVSAGGGVAIDLRRKTVTPSLDYTYSYEIAGHLGTPLSVLSHDVARHTLEARLQRRPTSDPPGGGIVIHPGRAVRRVHAQASSRAQWIWRKRRRELQRLPRGNSRVDRR